MKIQIGTFVLATGLALSAHAQDRAVMPDAQVESNVLRALASAPELSTQDIKTTTVYGVVTLSGTATDEASRTKAEQLASRAQGVQKVIDQLTLGAAGATQAADATDPHAGMVLQSDGTYAALPPDQQAASAPLPPAGDGQAGPPPAYSQQQPQQPPYEANGAPQQNPDGAPAPLHRPMYDGRQGYAPAPVQPGRAAGWSRRHCSQRSAAAHTHQPGAEHEALAGRPDVRRYCAHRRDRRWCCRDSARRCGAGNSR